MIQRIFFGALAVVIVVWAVNEPSLDYGFVYDDHTVIEERPPAWAMGWREFLTTRSLGVGRHVTLLSLDLDRRDPLSPRPFHVTNTILAAANAVMVLALGVSLGLTPAAALVGSLLFAVQPTHVDAVVSIVGRAELLAALGVIAAVWLHVNAYFGRAALAALAGVSFLLALASKESAACLPLLLLLAELFRVGRSPQERPRAWAVPYLVALVAWGLWVRSNFASTDPIATVDNPLAAVDAVDRVLRAGELLWKYVAWTLWPFGLKPDRGYAEVAATTVAGPTAWLAWAAVSVGALSMRGRSPLLGFALLWLPASFAVTGNVIMPIGTLMAERLLYLPSVGPCLLIALTFEKLGRSRLRGAPILAGTAAAGAVLLFAFAYQARARVWSSDAHYHETAAALSPHSAKAHYNLALSLAQRGRYAEAEQSFARALAIVPDLGAAAYYRAEALSRLGRVEEAAEVYRMYLETAPNDVNALRAAAQSEARIGRFDTALAYLRHALEVAPERPELRSELIDLEGRARAAQSLKASSSTGSR